MERHNTGQGPIVIAWSVHCGIEAVRRSGLTNMLDRPMVAEIAQRLGYPQASEWIKANPSDYAQGIFRGFDPIPIDWDAVQIMELEDCKCGCGGRVLCEESDGESDEA